jgi:uncharacterized protein YacL
MAPASVNVARLIYLLVCEGAGVAIALSTKGTAVEISMTVGLIGGLVVGGFFIWIESLIRGFSLRGFSTATFGLLVGVFCAWLLSRIDISTLISLAVRDRLTSTDGREVVGAEALITTFSFTVQIILYASLGFLGAVLALRSSRDDFAFILPYVRFRQDSSSGQPIVLDAESVMDSRVPGVARSGFLSGRLVVPRFVLDEIQAQAGSPTPAKRQRAERGLASLESMRSAKDLQVSIEDSGGVSGDETLTGRLLQVAQLLGARLMSSDENLCNVAKLRGIEVLNLDNLGDALRPQIVVGEKVRLALVRGGKDEHQGVGYLPDGTMIVVNHSVAKIGTTQDVVVISTLQTSGGTMVFAELAAG